MLSFCVQSCCVFVPQDDDVFDPTTQQVTASLPTLSSSFYPSYYVLPPPSRSSLSVSPAQPLRAPPFHLLPLTSHQLPSPPTSFFQNASSPLTIIQSTLYRTVPVFPSSLTSSSLTASVFDTISSSVTALSTYSAPPTSSYHHQQQPSSSRFTVPKTNQQISSVIIHLLSVLYSSDFVYTAVIMNSIINHEFH